MKKFFLGFLSGFLTAALIMFILGYIISRGFNTGEFSPPDLKTGNTSEKGSYDLQLINLKDNVIMDSTLLRKKVVILNFWERWCRPCRRELNSLEQLYRTSKDTSVVFAIISREEPVITAADSLVHKSQLPFYHLKSIIPEVYNGQAVPRTFIINKYGNVVVSETGARDWATEAVVKFIDSLKKL